MGLRFMYILLVSLFSLVTYAQNQDLSLISFAGDSFTNDNYIIDWSFGEIAITTLTDNNKYTITQGFHQPYLTAQEIATITKTTIYNIITPKDEFNNSLYIENLGSYDKHELFIFNRWGETIKHFGINEYQNDETAYWQSLISGTYYYIFKFENPNKEEDDIKGSLYIINEK